MVRIRHIICGSLTLSILLSVSGCGSPGERYSFRYEGRTRYYWVFQPELLDGGDPLPLVINLHGFSESAALEAYRSDMNAFAEKEYFIVCYPEGTGLRKAWNTKGERDADDVGFISALIDTLISNYNIDTTRIYLVGFSNGSRMAMIAGSALSRRISAIAVAGSFLSKKELESLDPGKGIRLIGFHARNDHAAKYVWDSSDSILYSSVYKIFSTWAQKCGCNLGPDTTVFDGDVLKIRWYDDSTGMEVVLWATPDGGHTWPGGKGIPFPGGARPSRRINANELMWEFFLAHPTPLEPDAYRR
jgi:polyhydroxybutyrate depolymerase